MKGFVALWAIVFCCLATNTHANTNTFWYRVATCETGHIGAPGDGKPRWDWGSKHRHLEGTTYEGGLGFYWGTWKLWASQLGLYWRWPHAYDAPPIVQILVAEYGRQHGGYWGAIANGCARP